MFDLGDLPPLLERLRAAARTGAADEAAVETMAAAGALACWAEALTLQAVGRLRDLRHDAQAALADELGGWDAVADRGGPCDGDEVDRFTAVEVAAALGLSTRTARDRVGLAVDVVTRQPALLQAMRAGVVGVPHARAVRDALEAVSDDGVAGAVVSGVLAERVETAGRHDVPMRLGALGTPAELAGHVRRDATRAGVDAAARCGAARARRRLSSWALPDGMAALQVTGPAVTIAAAVAAVDRRAQDAVDAARVAVSGADGAGGASGASGVNGAGGERGAGSGAGAATGSVPTLDQARADAVLEALTGSPDLERLPGRVGLDVTVLVPLEVLTDVAAGRSRTRRPSPGSTAASPVPGATAAGPPAEPPGLGPLPDTVARAVAAAARRITVVGLDPAGHVATPCGSGHASPTNPPDLGPHRRRTGCSGAHEGADGYRPGAALDRAVRARDVTCRWPGCRARAARCDIDHTTPFPEGPTAGCNLACLCRLHHRVKHRAGWLVLQGPFGRLDLLSPTGRVHVTEPASWHRRRAPDPDGPHPAEPPG